jgi:hypothetical protein
MSSPAGSLPRYLAVVIIGLAIGGLASGCREQPPDLPYNRDLGDAQMRLLPVESTVHAARDASIMNGTATIVKRGEEPPEIVAPTPEPTAEVNMPPASSLGEALGNIRNKVVANLMGEGESQGGSAGRGAESPAETTPNAPTGAPVSPADAEEVTRLLEAYNAARRGQEFGSMDRFVVSDQKQLASDYYSLKEDLSYSLAGLLDALERSAPGTKARIQAQLSAAFQPVAADGLVQAEPDVLAGQWAHRTADGQQMTTTVTFRRERGELRLVDPLVPDQASWPDVQAAMRGAIDDLTDMTDAILEGSAPDQAKLSDVLQRSISMLVSG